MVERQPSAQVLVQDDERRARDGVLVDAEPDRDAARQHGLAGPELAPQGDDVARRGVRREALAQSFGVQGGVTDQIDRDGISLLAIAALRIGGVHERVEC